MIAVHHVHDIKAVTLGWGVDAVGDFGYSQSSPEKLQVGDVNMVNRNDCGSKFEYSKDQITSGMVCANSPQGTDSCQGDSGGPLYVPSRGVQVGVVSWGIGSGLSTHPGVYTDVGSFNEWIVGITGELNGPASPPTPAPPTPPATPAPTPAPGAWCYLVAECDGAIESSVNPGTFWAACDSETPVTDSPVTDEPTTSSPKTDEPTTSSTKPQTDEPTTTSSKKPPATTLAPTTSSIMSSTSTAAPPSSVCGAGSYAMLMDNGICPTDTHELIESADDCEMAATEVLDNDRYFKFKVINNKKNPKGCFNKGKRLYFNQKGETTSKNTKKKAICCTAPSTTSSTDMPWTDYDYGNDGNNDGNNGNNGCDGNNDGNNGNNGCECKSEWQFDGATYEQCSFTPDDLENSWCYTESECDGSSVSESYAGNSWTFCSIKNNKRASFGSAVQHKSAAATGAAVAEGASSSSDGSDGGSAGAGT